MKKGFTLLELLITIAIVGILTGVAIQQYLGYQARAKVEVSRHNHIVVTILLQSTFAKCSAGSIIISLNHKSVNCSDKTLNIVESVKTYFKEKNLNNPYDLNIDPIIIGNFDKALGAVYLTVAGNEVTITTQVESNTMVTEKVIKE